MNKITWIANEIVRDIYNARFWILKIMAIIFAVILIGIVMKDLDLLDYYLPVVLTTYCIGAVYHWYSRAYRQEQEKIINKLRGKK
jgi:hypothetical protein